MPIFSNGSEYHNWQSNNCHQCTKYECESTTEDEAGCKLAFALDFAQFGDEPTQETLDAIGWDSEKQKLTECKQKKVFYLRKK